MRKTTITLAAAALAATAFLSDAKPAKAEGGVLIGIGVYLVADLIVGKKCKTHIFPFNIVKTVGYAFKGVDACHYGPSYRHVGYVKPRASHAPRYYK
jgi:outer membrane scaffolding protein for murein synthesis (MipA/OmpV family)